MVPEDLLFEKEFNEVEPQQTIGSTLAALLCSSSSLNKHKLCLCVVEMRFKIFFSFWSTTIVSAERRVAFLLSCRPMKIPIPKIDDETARGGSQVKKTLRPHVSYVYTRRGPRARARLCLRRFKIQDDNEMSLLLFFSFGTVGK